MAGLVASLARLHHYLHDAMALDLSHLRNPFLNERCLLRRQLRLLWLWLWLIVDFFLLHVNVLLRSLIIWYNSLLDKVLLLRCFCVVADNLSM